MKPDQSSSHNESNNETVLHHEPYHGAGGGGGYPFSETEFLDEEAIFSMPSLLVEMVEGMLLSPLRISPTQPKFQYCLQGLHFCSVLSPRVAFLDHQRLILNVDNSALKQRIAALAKDKIFKDEGGWVIFILKKFAEASSNRYRFWGLTLAIHMFDFSTTCFVGNLTQRVMKWYRFWGLICFKLVQFFV